jgi:hypothetical protein
VGEIHDSPLKVQVVDRYGNGVSAFPVTFSLAVGDLEFQDTPFQTTDAGGFAEINVRQGYLTNDSAVTVTPAGAPLPDLAGSSQSIISLRTLGTTNNSGTFDLNFPVGTGPEFLLVILMVTLTMIS